MKVRRNLVASATIVDVRMRSRFAIKSNTYNLIVRQSLALLCVFVLGVSLYRKPNKAVDSSVALSLSIPERLLIVNARSEWHALVCGHKKSVDSGNWGGIINAWLDWRWCKLSLRGALGLI